MPQSAAGNRSLPALHLAVRFADKQSNLTGHPAKFLDSASANELKISLPSNYPTIKELNAGYSTQR